ncbi:MAG TPA: hypothetical protein VF909_07815 [Roseiflexaceae bacterium]
MTIATDYTTIDRLPRAELQRLHPATLASLDALLAPSTARATAGSYDGGLWGALFGLFWSCDFSDPKVPIARQALAELGFVPPAGELGKADVLAAIDAITECRPWHSQAFENRLLYAAALAFAADEPYAASTILDGPDGAGIGWDLTRQELGAPARE